MNNSAETETEGTENRALVPSGKDLRA
jgi:hypothetical protein